MLEELVWAEKIRFGWIRCIRQDILELAKKVLFWGGGNDFWWDKLVRNQSKKLRDSKEIYTIFSMDQSKANTSDRWLQRCYSFNDQMTPGPNCPDKDSHFGSSNPSLQVYSLCQGRQPTRSPTLYRLYPTCPFVPAACVYPVYGITISQVSTEPCGVIDIEEDRLSKVVGASLKARTPLR